MKALAVTALLAAIALGAWESPMARHWRARRAVRKERDRDAR